MTRSVKPGDIVQHFKREQVLAKKEKMGESQDCADYLYEVLHLAHHSETGETMVVYRALYEPYLICARPLEMFLSEVDREKYPEVRQRYRFEIIEESEPVERWREEKEYVLQAYRVQNRFVEKGAILFVGSSLMEMFPIAEWSREYEGAPVIYNRGIGGYTTRQMLEQIDTMVLNLEPSRIFINIGTNDLAIENEPIEAIIARYREILRRIRESLPMCEINVMAYYPGNYEAAAEHMKACLAIRNNARIAAANAAVEAMAGELGLRFVDFNAPLMDEQGRLKAEYTLEGLHINEAGYRSILPVVMEEVMRCRK